MRQQLQAIATVLSLINPAICAALFAPAVAGQSSILTMLRASRFGRW
jgi:hypothetical protein